MLNYNETNLLKKVKSKLGYPHNPIEIDDAEITEILTDEALRDFSKYFPVKENFILDANNKVFDETRRYQLVLPAGQELVSVQKIISGNIFSAGINVDSNNMISFGLNGADDTLINALTKTTITYRLEANNIIFLNSNSISTSVGSGMVAVCHLTHAKDLSTLGVNQVETLETLSLKKVAERLVAIRSMYEIVSTPMGEVNLNLELLNKYIELGTTLEEELKKAASLSGRSPVIIA